MGVSDDLDMGEILGTEEGIEALAEFIETSGAFKKTGQLTLEIMEPRLEDATVEGGNEVDWEQKDGDKIKTTDSTVYLLQFPPPPPPLAPKWWPAAVKSTLSPLT
ncbi:hypothetical protein F5876DRAFT_74738 [Lentinula aff. lateritia]|uniref:Uncharacterized protein n=1 Tax=Lentinula aff. lateritia TaxID=2804960 RepID=A0ACC1U682_9AGAR|nr:hypothetical protein F5876DRAFT_74738 [Lentinula aff. lateritia]